MKSRSEGIIDTLGEFWSYCRRNADRLVEKSGDDVLNTLTGGMRTGATSTAVIV
jgi:hypothetical protein